MVVGPAGPARGGWPGLAAGPVRCVLGARKAWTGLETGPSGKGGEGKGELGGGSGGMSLLVMGGQLFLVDR